MDSSKCAKCGLNRAPGYGIFCMNHGSCEDCENPRQIGKKCILCMDAFVARSLTEKETAKEPKKRKRLGKLLKREVPKELHEFSPKEDQADSLCAICGQELRRHGWYKLYAPQAGGLGPKRGSGQSMPAWILAKKASRQEAEKALSRLKQLKSVKDNPLVLLECKGEHVIALPLSLAEQEELLTKQVKAGHWLLSLQSDLDQWQYRDVCLNPRNPEVNDLSKFHLDFQSLPVDIRTIYERTS